MIPLGSLFCTVSRSIDSIPRVFLGSEVLRGPLIRFDAELKMNVARAAVAVHDAGGRPLDDISPILEYATFIFRESGEGLYHCRTQWVLATVYINRGRLASVTSKAHMTQAKTDCF